MSEYEALDIAPSVAAALANNKAVVALESTIISHGMPYPQNVDTAMAVHDIVHERGAVPATIALIDGRIRVGASDDEIKLLGNSDIRITKTSRRDLPFVMSRNEHGATTVAATMIIAAMAGIRVFATGGIGGVHRGAEDTMDISADLEELAQTDVAVVCSGIKSVLDVGRTLEYLETVGVPVVGFGTDSLPGFFTRNSEYGVDYRVDTVDELAEAIRAKQRMGLRGGMLITNPIPERHALTNDAIDTVIDEAIAEMARRGIKGKNTTPFLLGRIADRTKGRSLEANIQLVLENAQLAADIAVTLARR